MGSDRIENFHNLTHEIYQTRGCSTFRREVDKVIPESRNFRGGEEYPPRNPSLRLGQLPQDRYMRGEVKDLTMLATTSAVTQLPLPYEYNLPVTWHGNGCGKWIYILSLDTMAQQCPMVAELATKQAKKRLREDQEVLEVVESNQKRRWNDER